MKAKKSTNDVFEAGINPAMMRTTGALSVRQRSPSNHHLSNRRLVTNTRHESKINSIPSSGIMTSQSSARWMPERGETTLTKNIAEMQSQNILLLEQEDPFKVGLGQSKRRGLTAGGNSRKKLRAKVNDYSASNLSNRYETQTAVLERRPLPVKSQVAFQVAIKNPS